MLREIMIVHCLSLFDFRYAVMTFDIFEKMGIPYCKPVPVLGNLPNLMRSGVSTSTTTTLVS